MPHASTGVTGAPRECVPPTSQFAAAAAPATAAGPVPVSFPASLPPGRPLWGDDMGRSVAAGMADAIAAAVMAAAEAAAAKAAAKETAAARSEGGPNAPAGADDRPPASAPAAAPIPVPAGLGAPLPADETQRLEALLSYAVLDTPPEAELDDITALAAETFGTPMALISLVDEHRQWFKSRVGLEVEETPRELAFCAHALERNTVLMVPDATQDDRFSANPLVTGEVNIRFYAGAPLKAPTGETLGTLCVIDRVPRTLTPHQQRVLEALGRQVMTRLELNRKVNELEHTRAALLGMVKEKEQTAEALRESEERLTIALDGDGLGVWDWNLNTNEVFYSDRWCSMLGYEGTEISPRLEEWSSRVHPEDLPRALHLVQVHLEGRSESYVCEQRMRMKDGSWRWIQASGKIIARDAEGRPARIVGTHLDISERKQSEKTLRQNQMLLRIAGQAAKLGGWSVTVPEFELTWSEETAVLHDEEPGFSPSIGASTLYYLAPHRQEIRDAFETCAREGTAFNVEAQILTAKGRKVWVRSIGEAVRDATGAIVRVQGAMQDISALKEAEESLVESQRRFRLLADAMPFVVWTAQPEGVVDFCNRQFYDYTGVSMEDDVTTIWQPRLHPEDLEPAMAVWMDCIREEKPFSTEYRVLGRDGAYRWFRVQALPVWNATGQLVKWYGAGIDIHEHKRLELEARQMAARLTTTMESITDAFLTLDRDWCFTYANAEAERLLSRTREEMCGQNLWQMFPSAVGTQFEQEYRRAMAQQVTVGFEDYSPLLAKWLEVRAYPSEEGLAVYLRDITERKRQEQHLSMLSDLGQRLNVAHSPAEAAEIITEVADGLFGWDGATLDLYTPERDLICPVLTVQTVDGVKTHVPASHSGEPPTELERQMLNEGAELLLHTFTDEEGAPPAAEVERGIASQMFAPIRDGKRSIGLLSLQSQRTNAYTQADLHLLQLLADYCGGALQRIHTESERRTSEERFRLLSKATNDAIWDWDLVTDSLWWNDGLETLFGQIPMK
ncbi:MAG: PAS domain-containing protein, partial [Prosthecobacter sp.]